MEDKKDWLERVRAERKELDVQLDRTEHFIDRLNRGDLQIRDQPEHYALLIEQRSAMQIYLSALDKQIELGERQFIEDLRRHG